MPKVQKLLKERYLLSNEKNWTDLAKRISVIYPPSYDDINEMLFLPSSPTLMNANTGGERFGTLSSCFTMGLEDSIEGIADAWKECAIVTKASGGVGYVFSRLRSSNENIASLNRPSSGPIPFANVFNSILDGIQQGGVRRGAGMGQFDINHPDILHWIRLKSVKGMMERLNLSIRVTDEFYSKLKQDPDFPHIVVDHKGNSRPLEDKGKIVTVGKLWEEIIEYAHICAEPGIFNVDIAHRQCTVTNIGDYVLSNPCAEYVSIPYSSCNLGSINLMKCITNGKFDWTKFHKAIKTATWYLNNVIDANVFPLPQIEEVTKKVRPIGLGAMGFAHMLYELRIPFNSLTADQLSNDIFWMMTMGSMSESCRIAEETGVTYPAYDYDLFMKANERFFNLSPHDHENEKILFVQELKERIKKFGLANSCFTSIAPNGSIGFIADTTGGIEPVFALTYSRKIEKLNREYEIVFISDPVFDKYLDGLCAGDEKMKTRILAKVAADKGSCQRVDEIPAADRAVFVVAGDLTPMEHLNSLAIVARNTSLSVSKTINLPSTATKEEIAEVYLKAYDLGVIGVTVYRDGCREGILVHNTDKNNKEQIVKTNAPKRPKNLPCEVYRVNIANHELGCMEKWIIFVGLLDEEPYEIMAGKIGEVDFSANITEGLMCKVKRDGKSIYQFVHGGKVLVDSVHDAYLNGLREYVTRLMSWGLRHGAGIEYLKEVLQKSDGTIVDFNKALIRAINKYVKSAGTKERCPTCNAELKYVEGCVKCSDPECSFSRCG